MNKRRYTVVGIALSFLCIENYIISCAGTLDITFNRSGIVPGVVKTYFSNTPVILTAAVKPNGKILVGGGLIESKLLLLLRYNKDGSLDSSWNNSGILMQAFNQNYTSCNAIAPQKDGKVVVAGVADTTLMLARFTATGSLDTSFNRTGFVLQPDYLTNEYTGFIQGLTLQTDNKIIVLDYLMSNKGDCLAILRYRSDGSLDTTFNQQGAIPGIIKTRIGNNLVPTAIVVQKDNKIIVGGRSDGLFTLIRYTKEGLLDTSFNGTGIVISNIACHDVSLCLQDDGKIVALTSTMDYASEFTTSNTHESTLLRYTHNGYLDTTFNSSGKKPGTLTTSVLYDKLPNALMIQENGKILIAGRTLEGECVLARYSKEGMLDTTFNKDSDTPGVLTTSIGGGAVCQSALLTNKGKIVVVGDLWSNIDNYVMVARYNGSPL